MTSLVVVLDNFQSRKGLIRGKIFDVPSYVLSIGGSASNPSS